MSNKFLKVQQSEKPLSSFFILFFLNVSKKRVLSCLNFL